MKIHFSPSMITQQQIEACKIATDEIESDLRETERELKDFQDELEVLERNPTENKTRIYMAAGHADKRRNFIANLKAILEFRQKPFDTKLKP